MCGEHISYSFFHLHALGSSPHVRGALADYCPGKPRKRIIPACAGSTIDELMKKNASEDHPRMCGEHLQRSRKYHKGIGSSPHVRGAPFIAAPHVSFGRIIPACAGSTSVSIFLFNGHWDHP